MARDSQVFEAVAVGSAEQSYEDDVQAAFDQWRSGLEDSESPGSIRVFRVPLDAQGVASHSASGQIRLGTWPVDQYTFDTLCDKMVKEFMLPTESMMAVRLIGTMTGKAGVRFNKIVVLQRPNTLLGPAAGGTLAKDGVSEIMRAMQESNAAMFRMIQEMKGVTPATDGSGGMTQMMQTVAMLQAMNKPMTDMMGPMMAALAGRPLPGTSTGGGMRETIETMMLLDKFMGRRGGGGGNPEPDWMRVTTAVAGVAKPLLELAVANQAQGARTRKPQAAPARIAAPVQAAPMQAAPTPPAQPVTPTIHTAPGVDLSQPSALPAGSLSPTGPDINAPSSHLPPEGQNMFAEMKKQIDALVEVARGGADPVQVGDLFFDQSMGALSDEDYGKLAAFIETDGFLKSLSIYNSQANEHAEWFGKLRAQLVKRITEADSDENSDES